MFGIIESLRRGRRHRPPLASRGSSLVLLSILALGTGPAAAVGSQMFATVPASTGEKPQSKLWYHDGSYWAILQGPSGVAFYEKVASTWQLKTFANAILASTGNADVKWNGTNLFVLNYANPPRLFKYSYNPATRAWVLIAGFPVTVPNPTNSETMVLEQDSTGRLWTTAEGGGNINVYYSTSADHLTWTTTPVVLQTGVNADDICSIVAFGLHGCRVSNRFVLLPGDGDQRSRTERRAVGNGLRDRAAADPGATAGARGAARRSPWCAAARCGGVYLRRRLGPVDRRRPRQHSHRPARNFRKRRPTRPSLGGGTLRHVPALRPHRHARLGSRCSGPALRGEFHSGGVDRPGCCERDPMHRGQGTRGIAQLRARGGGERRVATTLA